MDTHFQLDRALHAVGELLERRGEVVAIVVVGGTALNLLGVVERYTRDVDVLALATPRPRGEPDNVRAPYPLPSALLDAAATVARDLRLPPDWLNTAVGAQWQTALPPGLVDRIRWERFAGLWVGLPHRLDLIHFKLYAAADDIGTKSRHYQDLVALAPTAAELERARTWVEEQDPSPAIANALQQIIALVQTENR
jgi:hypothetical protein